MSSYDFDCTIEPEVQSIPSVASAYDAVLIEVIGEVSLQTSVGAGDSVLMTVVRETSLT